MAYFSWVDFSAFGAMLLLSAIIGIYFGFFSKSKQNTPDEYLLGGKSMGAFPIAMSLIATNISAIILLAVPAEVYLYGSQYIVTCVCMMVQVLMINYVYLPVFFELRLTSAYEYLERRFDRRARLAASLLFALGVFLYLPVVIYAPSIAFSQATGANVHMVALGLSMICVFYTTIGGMRAVVWTDTLQTIVMYVAIIFIVWLGTKRAGGFSEVLERAEEGGRLIVFNMDPSPFARSSYWSFTIGITTMWLAETAISQTCVQRYMSVPSLTDARTAVYIFGTGMVFTRTLAVFSGLLLYAEYYNCDPLSTGGVEKADQLIPLYVSDVAGHIPGLSGLFIAGVFSAALSTLSSGLNTLSGVIYEDFVKGYLVNPSEKKASNIMKISVICIGLISMLLVLVVEHLGNILQLCMSLSGMTAGSILGLFSFGMLFPRANTKGAVAGSVVSLLLLGWILIGAQLSILSGNLSYPYLSMSTDGCNTTSSINMTVHQINPTTNSTNNNDEIFWLYRIGFMYYSLIGALVVFIVGIPVSLLTEDPGFVDPSLLTPIVRRWAPKASQPEYSTVMQELREIKKIIELDK